MIAYKKIFCIVGLGKHAKLKLIPTILNIKKTLIVSVTRNSKKSINGIKNYKNTKTAIKTLSNDTNFIISTPPNTHYPIAKEILKQNAKVFIEKPAFVSFVQYREITDLVKLHNSVLVELYAYKFSKIYKIFLKNFHYKKKFISELNINFLIPAIPKNTFRNSKKITNSSLFDIGCYPISLLIDIGFKLKNFNIIINNPLKVTKESMKIYFVENNIKINIHIGISKFYKNNIMFKTSKKESFFYDYFFYGVAKEKKIIYKKGNKIIKKTYIHDHNSFEKIFIKKINFFQKNQKNRLNAMGSTIKVLENLAFKANIKRFL